MAAGVTTQAGVKWNTVSYSPSVVQLNPPLRQAAGTLGATGESAVENARKRQSDSIVVI